MDLVHIFIRLAADFHWESVVKKLLQSRIAVQRGYPTEGTRLLRRTCRIATGKIVALPVLLCVGMGLSACSTVNGWFGGKDEPAVEAPPAEGRPFPNLGTVPPRPRFERGAAEAREREVEELAKSRDSTIQADRALRDEGRF